MHFSFPFPWPRRLLATALMICVTVATSLADPPRPTPVALQGTYLQLHAVHRSWQPSDWRVLFSFFRDLGMAHVIVQWTALDGIAFDRPAESGATAVSVLDSVLQLADEHGMSVLVGLNHETQYWKRIKGSPAAIEAFLAGYRMRALELAERLQPQVETHPSFHGWYLTEEVENETWADEAAKDILVHHLDALSRSLRVLTPSIPVALSGFANGDQAPEDVRDFWMALLARASVNILLFQDGIGTGKLTLDALPDYMAAVDSATTAHGRDLWVVTEIFRQVAGAPLNDLPFRAVPAPLDRIVRQLEVEAPHGSRRVAFSVPEYMTPLGGLDAGRLYVQYLAFLSRPFR